MTGKAAESLAAESAGAGARDVFKPQKKDPFSATKKTPSLMTENRAMSVGNLSLSSHGGAGEPLAVNKKPGMLRTSSSAHLTMSSYLESINDNDEGDDSGIFF